MMTDDERAAYARAEMAWRETVAQHRSNILPVAMFAAGIAYAQKWRGMESAPKDGTRIFVFARKYYAAVCWDESGDGSFQWEDYDCNRWSPTHWMPLPLPPTEAK